MRGWRQLVAFALVPAGVGGVAGFREDKVRLIVGPGGQPGGRGGDDLDLELGDIAGA
jgi:hypothetical protein